MKEPINRSVFQERTGLALPTISSEISLIVPLRDIVEITNLQIMPAPYLEKLLRSITLEGDSTINPYKNSEIKRARIDPSILHVGQTFVERGKYQRLIETLSSLFGDFCVNRGFAKCTALIISGKIFNGTEAVAHYLPPIIEMHNGNHCLIDGVHRNYVTMSIGTTIESIIISGTLPPPCDFSPWDKINIVEEKPPRELRFRNLLTYNFRNLAWSGIDG